MWAWAKLDTEGYITGMNHESYGDLSTTTNHSVWEFVEVWYWYDADSNTRWGRIYLNDVQVGGDTNFGLGAPAAGYIQLIAGKYNHYIDDVEVWA